VLLGDKLHHFVGKFVSSLGATFAGKEAENSLLLKHRLGLVEGWTGEPEGSCGIADGIFLDLDLTQYLVLDLEQIVGVEELVVLEQRMGDGLRPGIESAVATKRFALLPAVARRSHDQGHM